VYVERKPDVGNGDAEPVCDGGDRDDDSSPELHGLELAGADEFVGGGAADAEEVAGLRDGQGEEVDWFSCPTRPFERAKPHAGRPDFF